ncbi:cilia- and flagella-associated protein 45-like [Petromyzon marinus]|uniref:cilia- and flagella-associated protein 45-like n=1 Tax=Petromyzon marinus TaxID=7757 RepID=UPI003F721C4A
MNVARAQEEAQGTALARQEDLRRQRQRHAETLRQQIRDTETRKLEDRRAYLHQAEEMRAESEVRLARIRQLQQKKIQEMRDSGLPEEFCQRVYQLIPASKVA